MIIFDECHHTRKNHAYNGIMREYFQVHPAERPKVFGMTASPIWNPKDAEGSLLTLEKNLDATVIAVREHVSELLENSPRPVEVRVFTDSRRHWNERPFGCYRLLRNTSLPLITISI